MSEVLAATTKSTRQHGEVVMTEQSGSTLLSLIEAIAISPADACAMVRGYEQAERAASANAEELADRVAERVIAYYANMSAGVGGASGLVGLVPGLGQAMAAFGGGAIDISTSVKLQVDMCLCLAAVYGHDIHAEQARHLAFMVAACGVVERSGERFAAEVASKAGVKMLKQYLRGAALQTLKELFRKVGIVFTRKALEKALPFGIGVVVGSSFNYGMTRYVGHTAKGFFQHARTC